MKEMNLTLTLPRQGHLILAQRFMAGSARHNPPSPVGTAETRHRHQIQPSLRDSGGWSSSVPAINRRANVERLYGTKCESGYLLSTSLRNINQ